MCSHLFSLVSPIPHIHTARESRKKRSEGRIRFDPTSFARRQVDDRKWTAGQMVFYYFQTDSYVFFFKYYINTCHFYRYLSQTRWGVVIVVGAVVALKNPTQKREIVYNFYYSLYPWVLFDRDRWGEGRGSQREGWEILWKRGASHAVAAAARFRFTWLDLT